MRTQLFIRQHIAVGQKTAEDLSAYGQGFNYWVEVGFDLKGLDAKKARLAVRGVLSTIDHKALGVDVKLNFEPTSTRLCTWLAREIKERTQSSQLHLRLVRGDGLVVEME